MSKRKTKPALHSVIRSALRDAWRFSEPWQTARKRAAIRGLRGWFRCAWCEKMTDKPKVDHIEAVGPAPGSRGADADCTWDRLIERLFCPADGLQILCKECHDMKTKIEREKFDGDDTFTTC